MKRRKKQSGWLKTDGRTKGMPVNDWLQKGKLVEGLAPAGQTPLCQKAMKVT